MKDGERSGLLERLHSICIRYRCILLSVADLTYGVSFLLSLHLYVPTSLAYAGGLKSCQEDHGTRACPTCEFGC